MGKQTANSTEPDDDYELKVLIEKCNVCHTDHHKMCKHHGEWRVFFFFSFRSRLSPKNTSALV
jgi:hypothetical protein